MLLQRRAWFNIAQAIINDPCIYTLPDQATNIKGLSERIRYYGDWLKQKGDVTTAEKEMKGMQIETVLNHLQTDERVSIPHDHSIPFLKTSDFNLVWKNLRITSHDYNVSGGVFSYISFEYADAELRERGVSKLLERMGCRQ